MENMEKIKDLSDSFKKEILANNNEDIKLLTDNLLFLLSKLSTINPDNSNFLSQLMQYFTRPEQDHYPIGRFKSFEDIKKFTTKELIIFKSILNELSILYLEQHIFEFFSGVSIIDWELSRRKLLDSLTATFDSIPYNFGVEEQFSYDYEDVNYRKGFNNIFLNKSWNDISKEDFEGYLIKPMDYFCLQDQVRCFFVPTYIKHALELFNLEFEYVEFEDIIMFDFTIEHIAPYFDNKDREFKYLSKTQNESICEFLKLMIADRGLFYNPVIDNEEEEEDDDDYCDYKRLKKIYQDYWINFEPVLDNK